MHFVNGGTQDKDEKNWKFIIFSSPLIKNTYTFHFSSCQEKNHWKLFLDHNIKVGQRNSTELEKKWWKFPSHFWFWFWFLKLSPKLQYQMNGLSESVNFQVTTNYIIPLGKSWIDLFSGNIFGKVHWNYWHQKLKKSLNIETVIDPSVVFLLIYSEFYDFILHFSPSLMYFLYLSWFFQHS